MTYKFRYDRESGAFYIRVRDGEYAESVDLVGPGFGASMDTYRQGNILGFEFLSFEEFAEFAERNDGKVEIPDRLPEPAVLQEPEIRPELRKVKAALESLPPKKQEVLRLRYMEGLTPSHIAEQSGAPVAEIVRLIHDALRDLREALGQEPRTGKMSPRLKKPSCL